ncbi:MAG: hypothetical protein M1819_000953 [Sarea resinae]|nr:MAG: hypothetical protein M1819_000953 [Sarea resinae]
MGAIRELRSRQAGAQETNKDHMADVDDLAAFLSGIPREQQTDHCEIHAEKSSSNDKSLKATSNSTEDLMSLTDRHDHSDATTDTSFESVLESPVLGTPASVMARGHRLTHSEITVDTSFESASESSVLHTAVPNAGRELEFFPLAGNIRQTAIGNNNKRQAERQAGMIRSSAVSMGPQARGYEENQWGMQLLLASNSLTANINHLERQLVEQRAQLAFIIELQIQDRRQNMAMQRHMTETQAFALSHEEQQAQDSTEEEIPNGENCSLWLTGLPGNVTLTDLFSVLCGGKVAAAKITGPEASFSHTAAAKVTFSARSEAEAMLLRARYRPIKLLGKKISVVWNRNKRRPLDQVTARRISRVLVVSGSRTALDEGYFLELFASRMVFQVDRVVRLAEPNGDEQLCFLFAYIKQAAWAKTILDANLATMVKCYYGEDPCTRPW